MDFRIVQKSPWRSAIILLSLAVVVRGAAAVLDWQALSADPDSYAALAVNLHEHGVYGFDGAAGTATAFRPPLFPWLLSLFVRDGQLHPAAIAAVQWLLSLGAIGFTVGIARRLEMRWPLLAGLLVVVDPLLLRAGQQVMTEVLATFLAVTAWWLWLGVWPKLQVGQCHGAHRTKSQWISLYGLGIVFGLSVLARPTAAPWFGLCALGMVYYGCSCWKRRAIDMATLSVIVFACIAPWTLRNVALFGRPIWATTHGGYTLLLANNPSLYQHFVHSGPDRVWDASLFHAAWAARGQVPAGKLSQPQFWLGGLGEQPNSAKPVDVAVHSLGELKDDELAYRIATETIRREPRMFAISCLYRVGWLWAWWPNGVGRIQTLLIGGWYALVELAAVIGLWQLTRRLGFRGWGPWIPAIALIAALTAVHAIYWSNMRMRAPAMPAVYLFALAAIEPTVRRLADQKPVN